MMKTKSLVAGLLTGAFFIGQVFAQGAGQIGAGQVWGNPNATQGVASPASLNAMFNRGFCSTTTNFPANLAGTWACRSFSSEFAFTASVLGIAPASIAGSKLISPLALSGGITATTFNGITITPAAGTLTLNNNTLGLNGSGNTLILNPPTTGTHTVTIPSGASAMARTDAAQTFSGIQSFNSQIGTAGIITIGTTNASAFYVANGGGSNPTFNVDTSTASSVTGLNVKGGASGTNVALSVLSSATNEGITLDAKGAGNISIGQLASAPNVFLGGTNTTVNIGQAGNAVLNLGKSNLATGAIVIAGTSSGAQTWLPPAVASGTITFPPGTSTLASLGVQGQVLAGGATVTTLAQSTGNITMDCGARPLQSITNGGAFTITAPAADGSCALKVTNNATAGTITFSGFSVGSNIGAPLTTVNGNVFFIQVQRIGGSSTYSVVALQ